MEKISVCARSGCDEVFEKAVHNQKYCSPECCRIETNTRLVKQYHDNKKVREGKKKRICSKKGCDTILSKYNKESICEHCKLLRFKNRLKKWGWDVSGIEW